MPNNSCYYIVVFIVTPCRTWTTVKCYPRTILPNNNGFQYAFYLVKGAVVIMPHLI